MLRGALVGCGYIVPTHGRAWSATSGAEIIAVCDLDRARAEQAAAKFGITQVFDSPECLCSALHGELDFLDITSPPASHASVIATALDHGLHILCQKPLAETMADLQSIVELVSRTDRVVAVNEMWKWISAYDRAGQIIRSGALGKLTNIRVKSVSNFLLPRIGDDLHATGLHPRFLVMDRLIVFEYGIHVLDMLRHWFGEPSALRATTSHLNPYCPGEDQASIVLQYAGFTVDIDLDWCLAGPPVLDVLDGDSLVAAGSAGLLTVQAGNRLAWHPKDGQPVVEEFGGNLRDAGFRRTHGDFVDAILHGKQPASTVPDNARSVKLMLACYASAADNGTWLDGPHFGLDAANSESKFGRRLPAAREDPNAL